MGNKVVGIVLAVVSGFFIGISFVFKKKGLLDATAKSDKAAGDGFAYLKNLYARSSIIDLPILTICSYWWTGMILMILGTRNSC